MCCLRKMLWLSLSMHIVVFLVVTIVPLVSLLFLGPWDAVLAQAQHREVFGRSAKLYSVPRWVDSGRQGLVWTGLQFPWENLSQDPADGKWCHRNGKTEQSVGPSSSVLIVLHSCLMLLGREQAKGNVRRKIILWIERKNTASRVSVEVFSWSALKIQDKLCLCNSFGWKLQFSVSPLRAMVVFVSAGVQAWSVHTCPTTHKVKIISLQSWFSFLQPAF